MHYSYVLLSKRDSGFYKLERHSCQAVKAPA